MEEKKTSAVDWNKYLPPGEIPMGATKKLEVGQVWAHGRGTSRAVVRIEADEWAVVLAGSLPGTDAASKRTVFSGGDRARCAVLLLAAGRPESDLMPPEAYFGGAAPVPATPAPSATAVIDGSVWKIRDADAARRVGISFAELGHRTCTARVRDGVVVRAWSNRLTGTSPSVAAFLAEFVPVGDTAQAAPPTPVAAPVDTYETRQAAHVARTDALMRRLKLDAGYPECTMCHNAVERVGKSGMCPECWGASRGASLDGDLAHGGAMARGHSLARVNPTPVAPWTPSVYAADLPDA